MTYRIFFHSTRQDRVLERILERTVSGSTAILDLDGCLFDTRSRQILIFKAWGELTDQPIYARVSPEHFVDRDHGATLRRAGVPAHTVERDLPLLEAFWAERFFDDSHLLCDAPLPGASRLARQLHERGGILAYLTARTDNMRAATIVALQRFGFPWGDERSYLFTKADPAQSDEAYKADQLDRIADLGQVTVALDNEPANVNLLADRFPSAMTVRVDTDCGTSDPLRSGIEEIRGFLRTTDP